MMIKMPVLLEQKGEVELIEKDYEVKVDKYPMFKKSRIVQIHNSG